MLRFRVALMLLLAVCGSAAQRSYAEQPLLVLGDSLSAGYGISREASWPHLLEARLETEGYRHSVVNASISGETTAGGARRLPALLEKHAPAVVLIALGANDGLRGIDPAETRRQVSRMVDLAQAAAARVVLVKVRVPPNYGPRYAERFEQVFDDVGARADVVYAPFMLERFAARADAFQRDGLHPTAAVQGEILDTLWPSIERALGTLATAELGS